MIQVQCRTNLDLNNERWPTELPAVPRVGDRVESSQVWPGGFSLSLEVVSVRWRFAGAGQWIPEIELNTERGQSISQFYHWYAPKVGSHPGAFI